MCTSCFSPSIKEINSSWRLTLEFFCSSALPTPPSRYVICSENQGDAPTPKHRTVHTRKNASKVITHINTQPTPSHAHPLQSHNYAPARIPSSSSSSSSSSDLFFSSTDVGKKKRAAPDAFYTTDRLSRRVHLQGLGHRPEVGERHGEEHHAAAMPRVRDADALLPGTSITQHTHLCLRLRLCPEVEKKNFEFCVLHHTGRRKKKTKTRRELYTIPRRLNTRGVNGVDETPPPPRRCPWARVRTRGSCTRARLAPIPSPCPCRGTGSTSRRYPASRGSRGGGRLAGASFAFWRLSFVCCFIRSA